MLGPRMYGDINQYPFVVFHYPPFYHVMVRAVSALGIDMLVAGRSISFLAALVIGAVCARLAYLATPVGMERGARLAGAVDGGPDCVLLSARDPLGSCDASGHVGGRIEHRRGIGGGLVGGASISCVRGRAFFPAGGIYQANLAGSANCVIAPSPNYIPAANCGRRLSDTVCWMRDAAAAGN